MTDEKKLSSENESQGNRIIGSDETPETKEKTISSEIEKTQEKGSTIPGKDDIPSAHPSEYEPGSLKERIAKTTAAGGLKELPPYFDNKEGDWRIIKSGNPFEALYLDYKQYNYITSEMAEGNYRILEKFWSERYRLISTGANRQKYEKKYGHKTVDDSISIIKKAYEKLRTDKQIIDYYKEVFSKEFEKGTNTLKLILRLIKSDGVVDQGEIRTVLEEAKNNQVFDLSEEDIAIIIFNSFENSFFPYDNKLRDKAIESGNTELEKLLSVDYWMLKEKIKEAEEQWERTQNLKIQILPDKYASTIEQIGEILFNDPQEAKNIIKEDLLKQSIAQKDIVLAREIGRISQNSKQDIHARYLEIIYKLKKDLPLRFPVDIIAKTTEELCEIILRDQQNLEYGKQYIKKGYIETWLRETNHENYQKFVKIRDAAENFELAFIEFLYTFNPSLPYRFANNIFVNSSAELCSVINQNLNNWKAGRKELYNKSIPVWLKTTGHEDIIEKWKKIEYITNEEDVGLERFLHLLESSLIQPHIQSKTTEIKFPRVQSGDIKDVDIEFVNESRGYICGDLSFSKNLDGITLSQHKIELNSTGELAKFLVNLRIDSKELPKGIMNKSTIFLKTSTDQQIEIPLSVKVVFPLNACLEKIGLYGIIFAAFFIIVRILLEAGAGSPGVYGWAFLIFISAFITGLIYFIKFLSKK
ncbi:MAG: hypothetical protein K8R53_08970 [Bacteroidales bacterium]|nr:hypothetical protein [Bacteroidales bacterium]